MAIGVTFAEIASVVTKKIYSNEKVVYQMIDSSPYFKGRKKTLIELGTDFTFSTKTAHSQGMGVRGDNEALPTPGKPTYQTPSWDYFDQYLALSITGKSMRRTGGNKEALVNLVKEEVSAATTAYGREIEFQCFGAPSAVAGVTLGVRGITNGAVANTAANATITLTSTYTPLRGIFQGMIVDFYDETNGQLVCSQTVVSVNKNAGTFVVDAVTAASIPSGAYVYRQGNRNRELTPLLSLVNDSSGPATVENLASSGLWQSTLFSNSAVARNLTFELLDQAYYASMEQNDLDPTEIWVDYVQKRKLVALHTRYMNYQNDSGRSFTMNGHNEVEAFGKAKLKVSSMCNPGTIYMMQGKDITFKEQFPFHWITEEQANNMWHWVQGYDKFIATAVHSLQHVVERRNLHSKIVDLVTA